VIARLALLGSCAGLASDFDSLLTCATGVVPTETGFEQSLAQVMRDLLERGMTTGSRMFLDAVAWLLLAQRWVLSGASLIDRRSPVGEFFRELLSGRPEETIGIAAKAVVEALSRSGLSAESLVARPLAADDVVNLAEDQATTVTVIYGETENVPTDTDYQRKPVRSISYDLSVDNPLQLFDLDRASVHSLRGVVEITLQDFNCKIRWRDGLGVFPPSIDTLTFVGDLVGFLGARTATRAKSVVDIGCGTGVLGLLAARNLPNLEEVHFVDIEPNVRGILSANILANWPRSAIHFGTAAPDH
jgi:hypothetical protein